MIPPRSDCLVEEVLRPAELDYCRSMQDPDPFYAARFAAKEALFKALGTGRRGNMSWHDVEVVRSAEGRPSLELSGETRRVVSELGVSRVHVSLTHARTHAAAVVLVES